MTVSEHWRVRTLRKSSSHAAFFSQVIRFEAILFKGLISCLSSFFFFGAMAKKSKVLKKGSIGPKDFLKKKQKVGKKKKPATNATSTDIRAKQVQMPSQSVLGERGEEVTHRKLGLLELLGQLNHHSPKVRRDALRGLQELCTTYGSVLRGNLARILEGCTPAAIDAHSEVRSAFRAFQTMLLETLPPSTLTAFAPTLALQIRSGLSHVSNEVRKDGLVLLNLYASHFGCADVLSDVEAIRVIEILCQMTSLIDTSLSCLYKLLQSFGQPSESQSELVSETPLRALLQVRLMSASTAVTSRRVVSQDSPIWSFCVRAWMQAGEVAGPGSTQENGRTSAPLWVRLRSAAVMERALEGAAKTETGVEAALTLSPSANQIKILAGIVKRGEWPIRAECGGKDIQTLVTSLNVRMARVIGLLAVRGSDDASGLNLFRLVHAAMSFLDALSIARFGRGGSAATAAAALAAESASPSGDAGLLGNVAVCGYAIRTLDLFWSCTEQLHASRASHLRGARFVLGPEEVAKLASITARFVCGGQPDGEPCADFASSPSAILAIPLAASLVGLHPNSASTHPAAVRLGWPTAFVGAGDFCLIEAIDGVVPGATETWVTAWPKLLWYLGGSDPELSTFLMELLLELARRSARPEGFHRGLFTVACPLLAPFFLGLGAGEDPPPVANLPSHAGGPQSVAAALLSNFPKASERFVGLLTQVMCSWSDVGSTTTTVHGRLGSAFCVRVLETILRVGFVDSERPVAVRLRVALTVLCAELGKPASCDQKARAEESALLFADVVAEWLMSSTIDPEWGLGVTSARIDDRCRLALRTLAWPLCMKLLARPALAPRSLCFLFFCVTRLPDVEHAIAVSELAAAWSFLVEVFDATFRRGGGAAVFAPSTSGTKAILGPLCDPERSGAARVGSTLKDVDETKGLQRLGRLFVIIWMRSVPVSARDAAYELLMKLCADYFCNLDLRACLTTEGSGEVSSMSKRRKTDETCVGVADAKPRAEAVLQLDTSDRADGADPVNSPERQTDPAQQIETAQVERSGARTQLERTDEGTTGELEKTGGSADCRRVAFVTCAQVLSAAISYRNMWSLSTKKWCVTDFGLSKTQAPLLAHSASEVQAALGERLRCLASLERQAVELSAMLPLL